MASSGAMKAQTFSCIIRQSLETGIEPCKKEIPSNLRSFKALKVPRPPTSQRPASETVSDYLAGRDAPSAGLFILERHEVEEVKEVNEIKENPIPASFQRARREPAGVLLVLLYLLYLLYLLCLHLVPLFGLIIPAYG